MVRLVSKVQFNNFEKGEFVDVVGRTYDETIRLIEDFPWDKQRAKLEITLTNPSITIEGRNSTYLKLAVYFNSKFVLYFLNEKDELFSKSFFNREDAYSYINCFFECRIKLEDFKKEYTWLRQTRQHFISQDFKYYVTPKSTYRFLLSSSGVNLLFGIVYLISIPFISFNKIGMGGEIIIALIAFLIGGGLNLIFFFNYYYYARNKMLIMSKGNDVFYFGQKQRPEQFSKHEISKVITYKDANPRSPLSQFALVHLMMKDGRKLRVPNIFLEYYELQNKLSGISIVENNSWPIM